jgi:hypothetical protein
MKIEANFESSLKEDGMLLCFQMHMKRLQWVMKQQMHLKSLLLQDES